jgi:beta-lactamase superfamily II metal-dependent hydrolase
MDKKILIGAIVLLVVIVLALLYIELFSHNKNDEYLKIKFFNVGKADSFLIYNSNYTVLIDTGENDTSKVIIDYLDNNKISKIDYLIITHFDKDHVGGASRIIDSFDIKNVCQSGYIKNSDYYLNYMNSLNKKNIKPNIIENTYSFNLDDLKFIIYGTDKIYEKDESNNSSLVVSLNYKDNNFLFTGDIEEDRISDFMNEELIKYDVIKMPHHGNYHKGLDELIDKIKVKYAIITNNEKDNKTINMLEEKNIKYYLTNKDVLISSDGNTIIVRYVD